MKKTFFVVAIVSAMLITMLTGCRAVERVPGVSAVQSALPSLPGTSPAPTNGLTTPNPVATATAGGMTAEATLVP